jgi:peptidoglycan/LPS O-acetylase OafA/YrhL
VPGGAALGPALANITLTQSLFAVPQYYFSFNAPSWSISTEAYFYLAYPLVVMMLAWRTWAPLLLAAVLVCVMISVALILDVPSYTDATLTQPTVHGLISVHPITRFFEFACGMSVAAIWPYLKERAVAYGTGTLLEIAAGLLAVISIVAMQNVGVSLSARGLPEAVTMWIRLGAAAIPFAAFVLVLSLEIGALARVLSTKLLVILGEASFAMYMLHQLILRYLVNAGLRATVPDWLMFGVFCAGIVVSSYVVWVAVERPSRTLLNRLFARLARG